MTNLEMYLIVALCFTIGILVSLISYILYRRIMDL